MTNNLNELSKALTNVNNNTAKAELSLEEAIINIRKSFVYTTGVSATGRTWTRVSVRGNVWDSKTKSNRYANWEDMAFNESMLLILKSLGIQEYVKKENPAQQSGVVAFTDSQTIEDVAKGRK